MFHSKEEKIHSACPVCGYLTLGKRGQFSICPVCFWEDDGDDATPEEPSYGPNGGLSLNTARQHFLEVGAIEKRFMSHVRPPKEEELVKGLPSAKEVQDRQTKARHEIGSAE